MNKEYDDLKFIFHINEMHKKIVFDYLKKNNLLNIDVISDEILKNEILSRSVFAVSKSGTVSLEISNHGVPSIILYKLSPLNFFLIKSLVKIKFVNIINIINNREIIPELLQSECNSKEIFKSVNYFLKKPEMISIQLKQVKKTIEEIKSKNPSADNAAKILFESFTL